jgi:hypothetical protein
MIINFNVRILPLHNFTLSQGECLSEILFDSEMTNLATISGIDKGKASTAYVPVSFFNGTVAKFNLNDYKMVDMWGFNRWSISSNAILASEICQAIHQSIPFNRDIWCSVFGTRLDENLLVYPDILDCNLQLFWGYPYLPNGLTHNEAVIFPIIYYGNDTPDFVISVGS